MSSKIHVQVGIVEEFCTGGREVRSIYKRWHYVCRECGQRLRMPANVAIEFDCNSCGRPYSVTSDGVVRTDVPSGRVVEKEASSEPEQLPVERKGLIAKMGGVVKGTFEAALVANDQAHGKNLRAALEDSFKKMKQLPEDVALDALLRFIKKTSELSWHINNWSVQGKQKMGRELQRRARSEFDFNQAESYALWLTGAWLESQARASEDARFVYLALEDIRVRNSVE